MLEKSKKFVSDHKKVIIASVVIVVTVAVGAISVNALATQKSRSMIYELTTEWGIAKRCSEFAGDPRYIALEEFILGVLNGDIVKG